MRSCRVDVLLVGNTVPADDRELLIDAARAANKRCRTLAVTAEGVPVPKVDAVIRAGDEKALLDAMERERRHISPDIYFSRENPDPPR